MLNIFTKLFGEGDCFTTHINNLSKNTSTMNKTVIILIMLFGFNTLFAQVDNNTYELNQMENLLTNDVEKVLDTNLTDKKVVFLGESNHYSGADLLAKAEYVKYLVLEQGYKDIAFESDIFALYFDHGKSHLYPFWSRSAQCKELFEFLEEHDVTIWGFDPQLFSRYTVANFPKRLGGFIDEKKINVDEDFIPLTETYFKNRSEAEEVIGKANLEKLVNEIDKLLKDGQVIENRLWSQFLQSYKVTVLLSSTHNSEKKGTPIRDEMMASNLDFLVKKMPERKFVVWLHNGHMIKDEFATIPGQTMGYNFARLNPQISYHIAFSSINMPYRKPKKIEKYSKDKKNLLHLLPTTENNYFIDSKKVIAENAKYQETEYEGMFIVTTHKVITNWFKHYDALVFISKGEDVKIVE